MSSKIYVVTTTVNVPVSVAQTEPRETIRLVRAKSRSAALAFVAQDTLSAKLAEPDQLVALTREGVDVEDAK